MWYNIVSSVNYLSQGNMKKYYDFDEKNITNLGRICRPIIMKKLPDSI